jgi:hypothetical protein
MGDIFAFSIRYHNHTNIHSYRAHYLKIRCLLTYSCLFFVCFFKFACQGAGATRLASRSRVPRNEGRFPSDAAY